MGKDNLFVKFRCFTTKWWWKAGFSVMVKAHLQILQCYHHYFELAMLPSHSLPLWIKGYIQRREPCSPHALVQEDPTKESKAKSDKTQIL